MKEIFIRNIKDESLRQIENMEKGCWINLENPEKDIIEYLLETMSIDKTWVNSCLDPDEKSRIEVNDGDILIIVRVPVYTSDIGMKTLPVGIIIKGEYILTFSAKQNFVIDDMKNGKTKIYTTQKTKFVLKLLERTNYYYDKYISELGKKSENIENILRVSQNNKEIYELLVIQKVLIFFSSAILSNEGVFEKIRNGKVLKLYEEDEELVEDIMILNKEINEQVKIMRDVLSNTLDAYASIISNNLNIVMKFLASFSIILTFPMLVASLYGMNVRLPIAESEYAFLIVMTLSLALSVLIFVLFRRRHWL